MGCDEAMHPVVFHFDFEACTSRASHFPPKSSPSRVRDRTPYATCYTNIPGLLVENPCYLEITVAVS